MSLADDAAALGNTAKIPAEKPHSDRLAGLGDTLRHAKFAEAIGPVVNTVAKAAPHHAAASSHSSADYSNAVDKVIARQDALEGLGGELRRAAFAETMKPTIDTLKAHAHAPAAAAPSTQAAHPVKFAVNDVDASTPCSPGGFVIPRTCPPKGR
jgi:hypothetical protein